MPAGASDGTAADVSMCTTVQAVDAGADPAAMLLKRAPYQRVSWVI
jgi:hypothetical protein